MKFFIIILIIILIFIFLLNIKEQFVTTYTSDNLNDNGFNIYKKLLSDDDINHIKTLINNNENQFVKEYLINNTKLKSIIENTDYVFQDYIWIIKQTCVHTCHRDNNGNFFNKTQKYPSYTILIYLEDMDKCLGVIPTSHKLENKNKFNINLTNQIKNIICNKGDVIIFNANLIHVGTLNPNKENHLRIQMKISHKDDLETLYFCQNYNKILNKKNKIPFQIRKIQKNLSCMFPIMADLTQHTNIESHKSGSLTQLGHLFSYFYYGDSNFYNLQNI